MAALGAGSVVGSAVSSPCISVLRILTCNEIFILILSPGNYIVRLAPMPSDYNIYNFQCHYEARPGQELHWTGSVHITSEGRSMQCVQFVSFVFE